METLILADEMQKGFPNHGSADKPAIYAPSLEEAMEKKFSYDAHMTQYSASTILRRLDKGALCESYDKLRAHIACLEESKALKWGTRNPTDNVIDMMTKTRWTKLEEMRAKGGIQMHCILFDIDGPRGEGGECTPEFRKKISDGVRNLFSEHPGYAYMTRGGGRIVYTLPKPIPINTSTDAAVWTARYLSYCNYVSQWIHLPTCRKSLTDKGHGIDLSCKDWGRVFRMPHATRFQWKMVNGKKVKVYNKTPENRATLGCLDEPFRPLRDMMDQVRVLPNLRTYSETASESGIFIEMLRAQNHLGMKKSNFYYCRCPAWQEHTQGSDDGLGSSCSVFGSNIAGGWGTIHCKHGSHEHLTGAGDWIRHCLQEKYWSRETFALSNTWRNLEAPDQSDNWGEHEALKTA